MLLSIYTFSILLLVAYGQTENSIKNVDELTNSNHHNSNLNNSVTRTVFSVSSSSTSLVNNNNENPNLVNENNDNNNKFETSHKVPDDYKNIKNIENDDDNDDQPSIVHLLKDTNNIPNDNNNNNNNNNKIYDDTSDDDRNTLMQIQQTQNILSTKERPELNPVLSALINEDVMKSIESKRAIEDEEQRQIALEAAAAAAKAQTTPLPEEYVSDVSGGTTTPEIPVVLTTPSSSLIEGRKLADNDDLIDQSITLEEAGTENNQKSRIQIKKGPNGQDYEYEYVYYYYDDDDDNKNGKNDKDEKSENNSVGKKDNENNDEKVAAKDSSSSGSTTSSNRNRTKPPTPSSSVTDALSSTVSKETTTRGKSRYTNIDRSGTSIPENEIVSKAKGRSSIPVVEAVDEGRLPQITRFPPRSKSFEATPAPVPDTVASAAVVENSGSSSEKNRKIGVKRPSLELVDSETFNTDEKQVKTNRILDNGGETAFKSAAASQAVAPTAETNVKKSRTDEISKTASAESLRPVPTEELNIDSDRKSTSSDSDLESTTPFMEKVAFDLYAILANENLNLDKTTDGSVDSTTDVSNLTDDSNINYTTLSEEEKDEISSTSTTTTTTTTTTTEAPTTTTTTTTTSTTAAPLIGGRRGLSSSGRNRFRLNKNGGSTSTTTTEAPTETSTSKGRNRFQRPSFGGRTRTSTTSAAKEEVITKEEVKPVQSSAPSTRGRTRNRFNIRSTTTAATPEKNVDENSVDEKVSTTTTRTLRNRPTLNIRGRGRPTTVKTTPSDSEAADSVPSVGNSEKVSEEKSSVPLLPTRPSRFNLNRPVGVATGNNRLLQRGRINPLSKTTAAPIQTESGSTDENSDKNLENNAAATATETGDDHHNQNGNGNDDKTSANETEKPNTGSSSTLGGLNRLKNRPRINVNAKTEKPKPQPISLNRKPNPLLARRKIAIGGTSTTEAEPQEDESDNADGDNEEKKDETSASGSASDNKDDSTKDDTTENVEVSSEQPRGLGLLGSRRRLPLRKPGTIL